MIATRTYEYRSPEMIVAAARQMDGLSFLQTFIDKGWIPPMAETLNFRMVEVKEGWTRWTGKPGAWAMNPIGSVHGGFAATVLDSALACAVHSTLAKGERYTTVDLNVKLVRPLVADQEISAESRIAYRGGRVATADAQLFDHRGKLAAQGTTSCLIMRD